MTVVIEGFPDSGWSLNLIGCWSRMPGTVGQIGSEAGSLTPVSSKPTLPQSRLPGTRIKSTQSAASMRTVTVRTMIARRARSFRM